MKHNNLINKKYKKACNYLKYDENFLNLASTVTGCVSISAFTSLVAVPLGIKSFAVALRSIAITSGIKKYGSIIKKKKKKHDKIVLLGKAKLDTIEGLIS